MWLWSELIDEMFNQKSDLIQCVEEPQCLSWNQGFFNTPTLGQLWRSPYTFFLSRQRYFRHPGQKSLENTKEM